MSVKFPNDFRSIQDLNATAVSEDSLSSDQIQKVLEIIRQTETPSTEETSPRSLTHSPAITSLNSLENNLEINQIAQVLSLIEMSYQSDLSIPIDPYHSTTWMDLFRDPQHVNSRQRNHHRNVCFCFLFALALDPLLDSNDKISIIQKSLKDLALDHSFDLYDSLIKLPPIMFVFILPYVLEDLKNSVLENVSDPKVTLSWLSVIFEHSNTWPESTQNTILKSLNVERFSSTRAFRIHTSAEFKHWFFLINRVSPPSPLHLSETLESFQSFITTIKTNVPSEQRELDVVSSLLKLSPAAAIDILARSSADIQKQAFKKISDLETLTFWIEAAFECKDSFGEEIVHLFALHLEAPSFLHYFHRGAALEVRSWAESVEPTFFQTPSGHDSCRCVIS